MQSTDPTEYWSRQTGMHYSVFNNTGSNYMWPETAENTRNTSFNARLQGKTG